MAIHEGDADDSLFDEAEYWEGRYRRVFEASSQPVRRRATSQAELLAGLSLLFVLEKHSWHESLSTSRDPCTKLTSVSLRTGK